ncbi:leucine-rich repeat domain-containing protein [Lachnospiraceae bacterium 56-18]
MTTQKQILKRILMIVLPAILFYGISEMTVVTALCSQTADVEINEENFPDAGFREYLQTDPTMMKLHRDPDKFTAGEIELITVLNMKNSSLTAESLAGIEHFKNLTTLHCNGTYLKSIDVSKNTKLQYLECSGTWNLTTLNVENCTELHTLYCNGCKLTELDLSSNGKLQVLWCDNNQFTALDTAGNPQLKTLYCHNNQLAALDFRSNPALKELRCYNNLLTTLDLSGNTALTSLSCENNQLTEIQLKGFSNLKSLSIQENLLTSLDVSDCPNLSYLRCSDNQLTELNITGDNKLTNLICTNNRLTEIDVKDKSSLSYFDTRKNLLKTLDVSQNTDLIYFYCDDNQLKEMDVSKNPDLETFWCRNNQLEMLDVSGNINISNLGCTGNRLKSLIIPDKVTTFEACEQYDTITLAENQSSYDLGSTDPKLDPSKISDLTNAQLSVGGMILTNIPFGEDVTYTYDCGNNNSMKVTLHFIWTNQWITKLTAIPGWKYGDAPSTPHAEARFGEVQYLYGTAPDSNSYNAEIPTEPGTWYVKAIVAKTEDYSGLESDPVEFVIGKNDSTVTFKDSSNLTKMYDGQPAAINREDVVISGSQGELRCTWYQKAADGWKTLTDAPVNAGSYKAAVFVAEDSHYASSATAEKEFEITKAPPAEIMLPENLSTKQGAPLSSAVLSQGWEWLTPDETVSSTKPGYKARLKVDDTNYDYTDVEGYDASTHSVIRELTVSVITGEETRIDITEGIKDIPETLIAAGIDTEEKIKQALTRAAAETQGYPEDNLALYDVRLQISLDGGKTWKPASPENFPPEGLPVTLPYPKGTNGTEYDFIITHMFTHEMNGYKPGEVEVPAVMKTEEGLRFTVRGLSPIAVAWKSAKTDKPPVNPGPMNPSIPGNNDTPTQPGTQQPSGDSDSNTPGPGSKKDTGTVTAAANRRSPQTGDEN